VLIAIDTYHHITVLSFLGSFFKAKTVQAEKNQVLKQHHLDNETLRLQNEKVRLELEKQKQATELKKSDALVQLLLSKLT
jgi:hypothetical protein